MKKTAILILLTVFAACVHAQIGSPGYRYAQEGLEYYERGNYDNAIREFLKADSSAGGKVPEYHYWLGRLHIAVADTSSAMRWFDRYLASGDAEYRSEVDNYLRIAQRQKKIFRRVNIRPLPDYVNSRNSDYGAIPDPEGKYLYFTSLRPAKKDKENIWRVELFSAGYGRPELVEELSTDNNEAFGCFSQEPPGAWIFGNYEANKRDGDIYFVPRSDKWFRPQNTSRMNSKQVETQPMVFRDRLLFFTSSREGGYGGTDIYVSEKIGGVWTQPQNLGPAINTAENEQTPFLDWDGRTLFFASRGHPGFGGYDIFKAYRIGNSWQEWSLPENLGLPINSTRNDRGFYHVPRSNEGYMSSDRLVSGFEQIYQINFAMADPASYLIREDDGSVSVVEIVNVVPTRRTPADEETIFARIDESLESIRQGLVRREIVPPPLERETGPGETPTEAAQRPPVRIAGSIRDQKGVAVSTEFVIRSEANGERNQEVIYSNTSGSFQGTLPPADVYHAVVNTPGYVVYSKDVPLSAGSTSMRLDIVLQKLEKKAATAMPDVVFGIGSSELDNAATSALDLLVMTLLANPELKVRLSGHAWEDGTNTYNLQLSEKRAQAVADYLTGKGIGRKRISWRSYGKNNPLDPRADTKARSINRRVGIILQN